MQKAAAAVALLVLGWTWSLEGLPVLPDPLYPTQENFDLTRFLGTWHDVAIATTCPYMQRHKTGAAIGKLVLQRGDNEGKLKMARTSLRRGMCKETTGDYELTTTPGRFFYHVAKWGADVDAYVVHTNYNEYAIVIMNKQKSSGNKSTSVKLYSRTKTVRNSVLDDFKALVKEQGMSEDNIIIKQDKDEGTFAVELHRYRAQSSSEIIVLSLNSKERIPDSQPILRGPFFAHPPLHHIPEIQPGDCVPGEQVTTPTTQPQPQRVRRNAVPSLAPADVEGSGDDSPLFNGTEACKAAPDTGPCFGMHQRYYYNSSSMNCVLFKYGGCLGNQNNFESERECLQRCRTEAVCRLPMTAYPCTGQPPIWAFDSSAGLCVPYKLGFCQANGNKFYSKAECEEYCGVMKDEELLKPN